MRTLFAAALCLLPVAAHADQAVPQPVSWWMAHPAQMRQVLAVCHSNAAYAPSATCGNVEAASSGLEARNPPDLAGILQDPRYWSANPIARAGALAKCNAGTSTFPAECRAVAQSALQAMQRRP